MTYLVLTAWYWLIPYLFISHHVEPSGALLFLSRMHVKDESISRYPEWDAYEATSNQLIPWRLPLAIFSRKQEQAT